MSSVKGSWSWSKFALVATVFGTAQIWYSPFAENSDKLCLTSVMKVPSQVLYEIVL